jgi:hypothetical protein
MVARWDLQSATRGWVILPEWAEWRWNSRPGENPEPLDDAARSFHKLRSAMISERKGAEFIVRPDARRPCTVYVGSGQGPLKLIDDLRTTAQNPRTVGF